MGKGVTVIGLGAWLALSASFGMAAQSKTVRAMAVEKAVTVDGRLNEEAWRRAPAATDFVQFEPHRGQPSRFSTEVRFLLSRTHLYVGVHCSDPEPARITASRTKRDSDLYEDDCIGIGLDTFHDGRTAYYFFTNPLGAQMDGRLADNGRTADDAWDAEWQCAARRDKAGWSAELAIPLESLKFTPGRDRTWGLGLVRVIPRLMMRDTWTGPMEADTRVSQFGKMTGLNLPATGRRLTLIPYAAARIQEDRDSGVEAGIDARLALSRNASLDATVNPDFATVEADEEEINLTRFELSLQEKRRFFLEGSEIYNQRIRLFYSRRIADIHGGVKLYGKGGGWEYSALSAQTKADTELGVEDANFSVLRLRRDVFRSSSIGFLAANRLSGGRNHGSLGLDLMHFFSEKVNLTGQLALSYGDYSTKNMAFFLRPSYDSSTFHIHLRFTHLGERFGDNANSVGFIQDDNRNELDSAVDKIWWIKRHGIDRLAYKSNYNIYWGCQGTLRSWDVWQRLGLDLSNRFSFGVEGDLEFKRFEKDFHNRKLELELGYNRREWQSAEMKLEIGRSFDRDYRLFGGEVRVKPLRSLAVEYELNRLWLDPDPNGENTWIHIMRLTQFFSRDLYLKFFYQSNSAIAKHTIQAVFVYRFQPPFGAVQLVYQKGTARRGEVGDQGHTIFLKISVVL